MSSIVISDLSICQPATQLARDYRHGTWRLIDYENDEFTGTMIYSAPGMQSPELTVPLSATGLHAIYLACHYPGQFGEAHLRVRLTNEAAYTLVRDERPHEKDRHGVPERMHQYMNHKACPDYKVAEAFWQVADLAGQDLIVSRFNDMFETRSPSRANDYPHMWASLVFVRLVPLSDPQVAEYERERPRDGTRRLFAMNDGGIFTTLRTREDIWAQVEPYRDSDVDVMLWATFKGETCSYRSRVARPLPATPNPFDRFSVIDPWDQVLSHFEAQGIDFMAEVAAAAKDVGVRVFPSLRLQGPKPVPLDMEVGSFYERHPEFRCIDEQGRGAGHLSMAFPEVRQLWISLLCEALGYGFDGVHVLFCRSEPFVYYEEPVIERFQQQYGEDMRQCSDDDPRFWQVMAGFVTQFARELKQAIDDMSTKMGKNLQIAYSVNTTRESNMRWGLDVEAFVKEGLIDYLIPHPAFAQHADQWLPWVVDVIKGTPVKLYPDMYPRRQPPAVSLYSADTLYGGGSDGVTLWDTYARTFRISEWAMMKRLGHRDEIKAWREAGRGDDYFRIHQFKLIGDRGGDPRYYQTNG